MEPVTLKIEFEPVDLKWRRVMGWPFAAHAVNDTIIKVTEASATLPIKFTGTAGTRARVTT